MTFEELRGYWPLQHDDATGVRDHLNQVHNYVVSTTLRDPAWERSTVLRGPLLDAVRELKARPGKDIVATGSMSLMPELVAGAWWTSTACSSIRSCSAAASGCSPTRPRCHACA